MKKVRESFGERCSLLKLSKKSRMLKKMPDMMLLAEWDLRDMKNKDEMKDTFYPFFVHNDLSPSDFRIITTLHHMRFIIRKEMSVRELKEAIKAVLMSRSWDNPEVLPAFELK